MRICPRCKTEDPGTKKSGVAMTQCLECGEFIHNERWEKANKEPEAPSMFCGIPVHIRDWMPANEFRLVPDDKGELEAIVVRSTEDLKLFLEYINAKKED